MYRCDPIHVSSDPIHVFLRYERRLEAMESKAMIVCMTAASAWR